MLIFGELRENRSYRRLEKSYGRHPTGICYNFSLFAGEADMCPHLSSCEETRQRPGQAKRRFASPRRLATTSWQLTSMTLCLSVPYFIITTLDIDACQVCPRFKLSPKPSGMKGPENCIDNQFAYAVIADFAPVRPRVL